MLALCGEIAQGLLMVFSTPDSARKAREHLEVGAARAQRSLDEIEIGSLVPIAVDPDPMAAYERMRPVLAFYVGFLPRYRRVAREAGFAGAVDVVTDAYKRGGMEAAVPA
jgi:alkanesulfonate monooxygenase SsuD/methylene tetrahydromethanopterin reductase-like flavin-dependent oxidoreductase (luciferase family)